MYVVLLKCGWWEVDEAAYPIAQNPSWKSPDLGAGGGGARGEESLENLVS